MGSWHVRGVRLPSGDRVEEWWVDPAGAHETPLDGAEPLPGRFVLPGLVDAHAHPATAAGPAGPVALGVPQTAATLLAWAESGVTLVRDVGSPGGLTLEVAPDRRYPAVLAAGRFLAPAGRYFPQLLPDPVGEEELVAAALGEIGRGAQWVKVIGDFPLVPEFSDPARTYPMAAIARLTDAVHAAGARVAVHAVLPDAGGFVAAGVDSIEHGTGLDTATLDEMARRGVAWTPTLCAVLGAADDDAAPPARREAARAAADRLAHLLPYAASRGVPVLAGTDVVGTLPREVALLARLGLDPTAALAAASDAARRFLGVEARGSDVVTYAADPRDDPAVLSTPAAVVIGGARIR